MLWKGLLLFYMYCLGAQERNKELEWAAWKKEQGLGLWRMNTISYGGELKLGAWSEFVIRLPLG